MKGYSNLYIDIFCSFLLSLYPISLLFCKNYDVLTMGTLFIPISIVFVLNLFNFVILKIINVFYRTQYDFVLISCLNILLLFYNNIFNNFQYFFVVKNRFFIPFFFVLISTFFWIYSNYIIDTKIKKSILIFLIILGLLPFGSLILTNQKKEVFNNQDIIENSGVGKVNILDPNIYYIILDSYPNSATLKNLNFDNFDFYNKMKKEGFITYHNAYSNYPRTLLSISSSLNFNYVHKLKLRTRNKEELDYLLQNNLVNKYLRLKGYNYYLFDAGYGTKNTYNKNEFEVKSIEDKNPFIVAPNTPDNDLLYVFLNNSILSYCLNNLKYFSYEINSRKIKNQFKLLPEISKIKGKKIVFAHIISPHPPYLFNENGKFKPIYTDADEWIKKPYLSQLIYINKCVKKVVKSIREIERDNNYVIIIQGDHGSRFFKSNNNYSFSENWSRENFGILLSIKEHTSNKKILIINKKNQRPTPVNLFRGMFNKYFNDSLQLKENYFYYTDFKDPLNYHIVK